MPFEDALLLNFHYNKHKNEFAYASETEYQAAADAFMAGPAQPPLRECSRPNGDRVRFHRNERLFAVQAPSGWLKTFHRLSEKYISQGYFRWECGRTDL